MPGGGGSPTPAPTTTTVQQNSVPPFLEQAYLEGIDKARAVSNGDYIPYAGQRISDFSPQTMQAQNMVQQGIGQFMPEYNAGVAATAQAATPFSAAAVNQYMDPYKTNVTDEIARLGNKNFTENILPGVNDQFTGGGMFGSSRNAVALGRAAENTQKDITGTQAQYLSSGYQNAVNQYQNDQSRLLQAGNQLTNQAGQGQNLYGNDVNAVAGVGQMQNTQNQQLLDTAYNDFLTQQQYPQVQAQFFNNVVRGIPQSGLVTAQTQNYAQQGNPITQALGLGGTLYGAVNGAPQVTAKLKKGGHVKAKKAKKTQGYGIGNMAYA